MKEIIKKYKAATGDQISAYCVPIKIKGEICGRLRPVTVDTIHNETEIKMLTEWRHTSREWFTTQFPVTEDGTRKWIKEQILDSDDRILFIVEDRALTPIGHVGLRDYDEDKKQCEFDNLLRGRKGLLGNIIIYALLSLGEWAIQVLDMQTGYLNVLGNNFRAIHIYKKLGFEEVRRVPLIKEIEGDVTRWVPAADQPASEVERQSVTMMIKREAFEKICNETL